MRQMFFLLLFLLSGLSLTSCSHRSWDLLHCNPLGGDAEEDCFLPYPSSYYQRSDPGSRTGVRINLDRAALPFSIFGTPIDPSQYSHRDGFSTVSTLLVYFPEEIDGTSLPDSDHAQFSLEKRSPIQLFRYDTGERVPLFAELDANADPRKKERQALILQPTVRLKPKTRYVALIQGLRTRDGRSVAPLSGFRRLRDALIPLGSRLEQVKPQYEEIFQLLSKMGIDRRKVQLAWDFTTGSDEAITDRLVQMRDFAQRFVDNATARSSKSVSIEKVETHPSKLSRIFRKIKAKFSVPSFLLEGNGNRLRLGEDKEPIMDRVTEFPLTIHVPECALKASSPLPVMIYGHGTFNSAENEMSAPYSTEITNRLCMIQVGTDWLGRAKSDFYYFIFKVLPNWNNFSQITDRLQQAHVNVLTLARLIKSGALNSLSALQVNGKSLVDENKIYYYGISEGACQGVTTLALSPDIQRGALNVPCGFWSMFFWRSSDFYYPRKVLNLIYPDTLEQQSLLALSQLLWDYTDPAIYASHLLQDPLPGSIPKRILYQEGINDASVPNLTTRAMVRTIGLNLLQPQVESVEGVKEAKGPLTSAYVQFDVGVRPRLGKNNVPPTINSVHEHIRRLEAAKEQLQRFLREGGVVEDTCGGVPCVF